MQMALAGHLPPVLTQGLALAAASTLGMLVLRFAFSGWRLTQNAWHAWQALLAIIGVVTVPQVLAGTFLGVQTLWPAYLSAVPGAAVALCSSCASHHCGCGPAESWDLPAGMHCRPETMALSGLRLLAPSWVHHTLHSGPVRVLCCSIPRCGRVHVRA